MTEPIGNVRFEKRINRAIEMAEIGKFSQAVRLLRALAVDFPKAGSVRAHLAWYLLELGRYKDALQQSRRAIILSPKSELVSLIHFRALLGGAGQSPRRKVGKYIKALDEMKRFLTIRPSEVYSKMIKEWETGEKK